MTKPDRAAEETQVRPSSKTPKTVNPVLFYDRDVLPKGQKDFRAKPVKVRPTPPPMDEEVREAEYPAAEPVAAETAPEPALAPPATHPSSLPPSKLAAKD